MKNNQPISWLVIPPIGNINIYPEQIIKEIKPQESRRIPQKRSKPLNNPHE